MANIRLLIVVTLHVVKSVPVCLEKNSIIIFAKLIKFVSLLSLESVKVKI